MTYFCPALDPPLGRSGRKTTTLVRDHQFFTPSKFHQNPSSGSGEEVENVKSLQTVTSTANDGQRAMTINKAPPPTYTLFHLQRYLITLI